MDSVHRKAADFPSGLPKQKRADRVVIARRQAPRYLLGFKPSGAAVFGFDVKLAKTFDAGSAELGKALSALRGFEAVEIVVLEKGKAVGA